MQKPCIKPSDMKKTSQYAIAHLDEWIERVDDDWNMRSSLFGRDEHLRLRKDLIEIFYSQNAQALRLIDHEYDLVVTVIYNVWSEKKGDFVDRAYFCRESEAEKGSYGIMVSESDYDSRFTNSDESVYREHMSKEQATIFSILSQQLRMMHQSEDSGITRTHDEMRLHGKLHD